MGTKVAVGCAVVILVFLLIVGVSISGTYNSLVQLDQATQAQWAQVQNAYQRRADLVPNLVATVKRGREKLHYLNAVPIHDIADRWIGKYQHAPLNALSALKSRLEEE